jgi:hypothetical protein
MNGSRDIMLPFSCFYRFTWEDNVMLTNVPVLKVYPAPDGAVANSDFSVRVRLEEGEWRELFTYEVCVDMHNVRRSSMATFDFAGTIEVEVISRRAVTRQVDIRPKSFGIIPEFEGSRIVFKLDKPRKLSIEVDGERFHNLHLFANSPEEDPPLPNEPHVAYVEPGSHRSDDLLRRLTDRVDGQLRKVLYFGPGIHHLEEGLLSIPSHKTVYLAGGAIVVGSMLCRHVENVTVRGRGIIYLRDVEKSTYLRSVQIDFSKNITVEGIISIDPPHYSIHLGHSEHVSIRNFKSFSTRGWCDGIDMMACKHIDIDDVFLRTSDDCIAIYGSRGEFTGDSSSISVTHSILWADVAHPVMIGVHGDHERNGDIIEDIHMDEVDILEHHEPQDGYWGCIAINAGDKNTVRNVSIKNVRVEQFELGRLFDIRVFHNPKYNPYPGNAIKNIQFENIFFNGTCENPSIIEGYDEARTVDGIEFRNLWINGIVILSPEAGNFTIGSHAHNVTFRTAHA